MREGVSLTYTIGDAWRHIDQAQTARIDGAVRVVKHDDNYHTDEIAVTTDH